MKTLAFALLCTIVIAGTSCNKENEELHLSKSGDLKTQPAELTSTDGLIDEWNMLWNTQDATGLYNLLTNNAVVIVAGSTFTGRDDAYDNFIFPASAFVANLSTVKTQENINSEVCWQKGSYIHDVLDENGNDVDDATGEYTIKWKLQDDGSWKVFHASL